MDGILTGMRWPRFKFSIRAKLLLVSLVIFVDLWTNPDLDDLIYQGAAVVWIVLACAFIGVRLWRMRRARRGADPHWTRRLQDPRLGYLLVATTVVTVASAVLLLLQTTGNAGERAIAELVAEGADPDETAALIATYSWSALLLIVLSWAVLHLSYAERYARLWAVGRAQGIQHVEFPGGKAPTLIEFVYLAITIGFTYATSDAIVKTSEMRAKMLFHSMMSFLYNTVIIAATVGVLTG